MDEKKSTSLSAITPEDLVRIWRATNSAPATLEHIRDAIADGAPTNPDGTINLLHITAWLIRDLERMRRERSPQARSRQGAPPPEHGPGLAGDQ